MQNQAYIGLGSNMGDSKATLKQVIQELDEEPTLKVEKVSHFYVTDPVGMQEQERFVNAVLKLTTSLSAADLLVVLHQYEQKYHRVRTIHWGPRTLDLDIELFNNDHIQNQVLDIPHREMFHRLFVLVPLQEILEPTHPQYQNVETAIMNLTGTQYIAQLD